MSNRKKKCKQCKEYSNVKDGVQVPAGFFCCFDHAVEFANSKQARARKRQQAKVKKEINKAFKQAKGNDHRHQFNLTKNKIQHWVNHIRDHGKPCISCGNENPNILYSGGHYKTAGGHLEIALDSRNIHRQCLMNCNKSLSGNISGNKHSEGFVKGLIKRYGQDYVHWLDSYHEPVKYTVDELRAIRAYYSKLIRDNNSVDKSLLEILCST